MHHTLNQHWCGAGALTAGSQKLTKLWTPELQPHPKSVFLSSVMKSVSIEKAIKCLHFLYHDVSFNDNSVSPF